MYKLGLAHEAKPERVAAPSIPIEESGPQDGTEVGSKGAAGACSQQNSPKNEDGTPASPHPSAPVVPGTGEATGEEATTAAPTRFLIHNIIDGLGVTFGFLLWNLLLLRSEFEGGGEKNKKRRRRSRDVTYSL